MTDGVRVLDEALPPGTLNTLRGALSCERFESVHAGGRGGAWTPEDGEPLASAPLLFEGPSDHAWAGPVVDLLLRVHASREPFSLRAFRYPPGTGLAWHVDAEAYTAAFILFVHERWESGWGGELVLGEPSGILPGGLLRVRGRTRAVEPLPNRLVLLRRGVPHRVQPVAAGAPDRLSVSGFFQALRPKPMPR